MYVMQFYKKLFVPLTTVINENRTQTIYLDYNKESIKRRSQILENKYEGSLIRNENI